ncbi:CU044_5270 family protein [Mycetocola zhujimingii]|uniref:Uncharacterized protein n=1 Tax=Mycetocola zhujimingii TaxID=2079792 RepID=A0A2U1TA38_9MICO|nr:CU044_5270 family protein [Mycetocola zhujimingii]PWC04565.1 hypothetical protein DF223_13990 [Mycetocola zhujimingii]
MTSLGTEQASALRRILVDTVEHPVSPQPPRRPLIAGLIAVPLAAALVVGTVVFGPSPDAAQASEALRDAADRTISVSDPFVGEGEYLKITTEQAFLAYEVTADGDYSAYRSTTVTEVFVPASPGDDWVQRVTAQPATEFYGEASHAAAERDWANTVDNGVVQISRDSDGDFVHARELGGEVAAPVLPSDPEEALAFLYDMPYGNGTDEGALSYAAQLLRDGTMAAEQRSTLYQALALLPGIRITDGNAALDGRTGIAFSIDSDTTVPEIIVDPDTGQFIGQRSLTPAAQGAIPAGTVEDYTAVTTTVVDEVP